MALKRLSTEHLVYGLFLLSLIFLLCFFVLVLFKQAALSGPVTRLETNISNATLTTNHTARYPVFHHLQADANTRNYIENKVKTFEQKVTKQRDIRNLLTTDFQINHFGSRTASVTFYNHESIAGHPDVLTTEHVTFDLLKDRRILFLDILLPTPAARAALAHLLHDYFKQQPGAALTPAELVNLLELSLADIRDFAIEDNAVILYLDPRQPAHPTNVVGVRIEKALLAGILLEDYLAPDANQIATVKNAVVHHITTRPPAGNTIDPTKKMLALTFDDGPSYLTPQLLDALKTYQADATFFVLGSLVGSHTAILRQMVQEGHEIGNHSWNHAMLTDVSEAELGNQIDATQAAIQTATGGYTPTLMRPPYGATNHTVSYVLTARGLHQTLWSADTFDWRDRDVQLVYERIMADAADGRVMLLHDIHATSVEAAMRAIRDLKTQGYQLVTVSQLFQNR